MAPINKYELFKKARSWKKKGYISGDSLAKIKNEVFSEHNAGGDSATIPAVISHEMIAVNSAGDSVLFHQSQRGRLFCSFSYNFSAGKYPVTNYLYGLFVKGGGYNDDSLWTGAGRAWKEKEGITLPRYFNYDKFSRPDQPVVGVSLYEGMAFCNWLSKQEGLPAVYRKDGSCVPEDGGFRLPSEAEWVYCAAKGDPSCPERTYPWGSSWDASRAACSAGRIGQGDRTAVVTDYSGGATPQGIFHLGGNVWEWCGDNYLEEEYTGENVIKDRFISGIDERCCVKGGSWQDRNREIFAARFRLNYPFLRDDRAIDVGFRIFKTEEGGVENGILI